ncbi:MAG: aminotransferase class V-fold PLP-dependent enzyme [Proteobacteria bacterium]|nr:aminotransferase class V-fold PLP-dependent enzyme [Pseudomonadota bacterium]
MSKLESYFKPFRDKIIGQNLMHPVTKELKILYADWAASGRLYGPIEDFMTKTVGPYVGNTHTETTLVGTEMTSIYYQARNKIKEHVNTSKDDVLILAGFGMTAVINKFQRLLGLKLSKEYRDFIPTNKLDIPLIILTHMEHHSNQTTWEECYCDVEIINRKADGLPDLSHLQEILDRNQDRKTKIGSFSACSNVTGIITPYHEMAEIMHRNGGLCFVDFSASAPYVEMNMHPEQEINKLDAIFFSPHKFLGGPGSSGVLIFDKALYKNQVPDHPGGGTVLWTNPWGEHSYFEDVEIREDGGTPGFLQAIRTALAIRLKEEIGIKNLLEREKELKKLLLEKLAQNPEIEVLEFQQKQRLGFVSFYSLNTHFNLIVKILNDRFGIQTRGGCSCAGTYGHILLQMDKEASHEITNSIEHGDLTNKPGWVRISIHPTMTFEEIIYIADGIDQTLKNIKTWSKFYQFDPLKGEYFQQEESSSTLDLNDCDL